MPALALLDSNIVQVEYSRDGGTNWSEVPGITNYSITRTAAEQRQVTAFGNRTRSLAGASGARTCTFEGIRPPLDRNWADLETLGDQRTVVPQFRITGAEREIVGETAGNNTAAIATSGEVTLNGTPSAFDDDIVAPGMAIKIGSTLYVIKTLTSAGVATVDPAPNSDVAAAVYSVLEGSARRTITGDITNIGQDTLADGGELTDTIEINVTNVTAWVEVK